MALGDGKVLSSLFSSVKPAGGMTSKSNPPASAKAIRSARVKTLAASVKELNTSVLQLAGIVEPALAKLDQTKVKESIHKLAVAVDAMTTKLDETNRELHNLSKNTTLLGLAFAGDGEQVLNELCGSVEKIAATIREIRQRFA